MAENSPAPTVGAPDASFLIRSTPSPEEIQRDRESFAEQMTATLAGHNDRATTESADLATEIEGLDGKREGTELGAHLQDRLADQILEDLDRRMPALQFTVPFGSRIIAPPYDAVWSDGNGAPTYYGDMTVSTAEHPSGAGVGLYLSVQQPTEAMITPIGTYSFQARTLFAPSSSVSWGGLGILFRENGVERVRREAVLWTVKGLGQQSASGSGQIAEAHTPAGGSWPVHLAPLLVRMVPGRQYQVWIWAWQTTRQANGISGVLRASMPAVRLDAGPLSTI